MTSHDFNPVAFVGAVLERISFGVGTIHLDLELNPRPTPGKFMEAAIVSLSYIKLQLPEGLYKIKVEAYADIGKLGGEVAQRVSHSGLRHWQALDKARVQRRIINRTGRRWREL